MSLQDNVGGPAGAALDSGGSHQRIYGGGGLIFSVNAFLVGMPYSTTAAAVLASNAATLEIHTRHCKTNIACKECVRAKA